MYHTQLCKLNDANHHYWGLMTTGFYSLRSESYATPKTR